MKKTSILLLTTAVLVGCSNNNNKSNTSKKSINRQAQLLERKFNPIIHGDWVNKEYIDKITETNSPEAAAEVSGFITELSIDTTGIKNDSLYAGANYGNHEGGGITTKFKPGKRPSTLRFNGYSDSYDLGYSIKNGDTTLILYYRNADTKHAGKTVYIKSVNKITDVADRTETLDGVNYLINKRLIAGQYVATDSLGAKSDMVFTSGGKVKGLSNFKTYYIQDDFVGPESNLDEIIFELYQKNQVDYAFKIKADTLSIFTTRENADSTELYYNKLVYKLVRSK